MCTSLAPDPQIGRTGPNSIVRVQYWDPNRFSSSVAGYRHLSTGIRLGESETQIRWVEEVDVGDPVR